MSRMPRLVPISRASWSRLLPASCLALMIAGPALAQGLESGVGHGPSQSLSVPPNETGNPAFSYGAPRASNRAQGPVPHRRPRHRPVAPAGSRTD